ncbi:MAG TPA: pentapeptide repeat-containing protein [Nitrosomonas sp.]|nr:pentapeptide repeat-containing protein [Nitrosomonas sp.]
MIPMFPVNYKKLDQYRRKELLEEIKESTERNRYFFFIWVIFAFYVIVTTTAITDLQLLLPNSTITLPTFGIQLPLLGYFLVTPLLVLILHFNLLHNLDTHAYKLKKWAKEYPNEKPPRFLLQAFLFDLAILEQGAIFHTLTRLSMRLLFYALGPITIGIILWRFSDYQNLTITLLHLIIFFLSFVIDIIAFKKIAKAFSLLPQIKVKQENSHQSWLNRPIIFIKKVWNFILEGGITEWILTIILLIIIGHMVDSPLKHNAVNFMDKPGSIGWELINSRLYIPPNTSLISLDSHQKLKAELDGEGLNFKEWWKKHGVGINLCERNLQGAILIGVDMRNAKLCGTNLSGANLSSADLQRSDLFSANLQGVNLTNANLEGADLTNANLLKANLHLANLKNTSGLSSSVSLLGASLPFADLEGLNLSSAFLINTVLTNAILKKADLRGANLKDTNLINAVLQEANLSSADLQRSDLFSANLQGANLTNANLQGANLSSAQLQEANLSSAKLQGSDLFSANLQGANLTNANLQGANLTNANLQGANLINANLQGAIFIDTPLDTKFVYKGEPIVWNSRANIDNNNSKNTVLMFCKMAKNQSSFVAKALFKLESIPQQHKAILADAWLQEDTCQSSKNAICQLVKEQNILIKDMRICKKI